ncbi:hypothetical protein [Aphanothece minutissima]|uniref:Uncharacterized protein n=1 Tax=Aphanothece cf. minutissima CCALA 015 TaxID=2107695 RepID=A0ABX5F9F5_9CHRO|nr:hypothetical protein [Aphanothece minutissima]PSB38371.1 hypothetical protein C7B81_06650 [Aphanothece cf. minutissima CCALA 015]
MRQHPISPVTEPLQYRAIGVVRGSYVPADPAQLTRGVIRTAEGTEIEAVVLGRLLTLMRRHLDLETPHLWVVYPRSREENQLHLQMVGVWEPSTLSAPGPDAAASAAAASDVDAPQADRPEAEATPATAEGPSDADQLPEGDDYFSIRGELIFTRPETGDLVIKVRQQPRPDGNRPVPFKLQLRGEIPLEHLRHFVALDLRRQGQQLAVERFEVIGPVAQRGNRGGRARRPGADKGGPAKPKGHGRAVTRQGR